ncbi:MAG TPA: Ig-like domain-containing protein [Frankiaceae bacterium]|jgi:hypothetical protein|nr:Ig-like domain-containing protein [Frankiaceae bacterium]
MRLPTPRIGLLVVAAVAATVAPAAGRAADEPAAPPAPREGCTTIADDKDDAGYLGTPSDPDLDILRVVLSSPPGKLRAYITVAELDYPLLGAGHQFQVQFKIGSKDVEFYAGESDAEPVHDAASVLLPGLTGVRYDGVVIADAKVEAIFDTKTSTVILTTDRAPIEAAAKASLADGTVLQNANVKTLANYVYTMMAADTATAKEPDARTYTVGDNTCFAPPEGRLALTVPTSVVSGHTAVVGGTLTNAGGTAVAGKNVTVSVAGKTAQVTSGEDGKFSASFAIASNAGSYPVTATWAGDDSLSTATATGTLVVKVQPTTTTLAQTVSGTTVTVRSTLLDDLRRPVAGQSVTWYVDGKAVGTYRTDSGGRTSLRTAKGKTVKAVFNGVRNRYGASSASRRT